MNRRTFLKAVGAVGAGAAISRAYASDPTMTSNPRGFRASALGTEVRAVVADQFDYIRPASLPKVINVYLYGGPSELAGNLTNIGDINFKSQNKYPNTLQPGVSGSVYTRNGFWGNAGGNYMETLLAAGDLSVYRTIHRVRDDNKAHGRSITQNLAGNIDTDSPGMAHTLALILTAKEAFGARDFDSLFLPFVSFEGTSRVFYEGDNRVPIPSALKHITLDPRLADSPFQRAANGLLPVDATDDATLDALAKGISESYGTRYAEMNRSLANRARLNQLIDTRYNLTTVNAALPAGISYPDTLSGRALKAAVSLALLNPDTLFIAVNGIGSGWDDHNIALTNYPPRMDDLMASLNTAVAHLKASNRNDVVINVFGDFGRNLNLNETLGWDHGNNQNFYTLGGSAIPGRRLGKLVGKTISAGANNENRLFTTPTSDSYQCEPFAIVASMYKYFGLRNPEILTGGIAAIDETSPPNHLRT